MDQTKPSADNAPPAPTPSRSEALFERSIAPPVAASRANPLSAWRLHARFGPVVAALERLLRHGRQASASRVLALGRRSPALESLLQQSLSASAAGPAPAVELNWIDGSLSLPLPYEDAAFDAVVAIDALPLVPPSARERTVLELGRVARLGVVLSSPFDGPNVVAAERAVNGLHRSSRGVDHPEIGRHLEYGLPDLALTCSWLERVFAHVATMPVEHLHVWQSMASLELFEHSEPTAADAADATFFPISVGVGEGDPAYRTLAVASNRPYAVEFRPPGAGNAEFTALAMHVALEGAAQRQSLDRLFLAVTADRERERQEFSETVASLAAELHEREAIGEKLQRDLRERDLTVDHLQATVAELERRIELTDDHVENLEAAIEATRLHARNLDAMRDEQRARADDLQVTVDGMHDSATTSAQHIENLEQLVATLRAELSEASDRCLEADARASQAVQKLDEVFSSRGGRALGGYVRMKRRLLGKGKGE